MGHTCNHFTFEQINRFLDNDLPQDRHEEMAAHCRQCPDCRQTIDQLTAVSNIFKTHVEKQTAAMDKSVIQERVQQLSRGQKAGFSNIFGMLGQHLYLKLGFVTAILVAGLFMFNTQVIAPSGPSAIVKYVDTEMPSVMIIETEKQKHTIIWFSET